MTCLECLSDQQIKNYNKAFISYADKNTGTIKPGDFEKVLRKIGIRPTKEEISDMLNEIGEDNPIDFVEILISIYYYLRAADTQEELIKAFKIFDTKGNGKISIKTINHILSNLKHPVSQEVIDQVVNDLDKDGSHMIDYAEMIKLLHPKA